MEWDNDNTERMVAYVNMQLDKGRAMVDIEREFGVNERVIDKRFKRKGYKKVDRKYIKVLDPQNPPPLPIELRENNLAEKKGKERLRNRKRNSNTDNNIKSNVDTLNNDEIIAIRELLENKDKLLKLLDFNRVNITKSNIRSKKNETKSVRVDSGLYEAFKKKVKKNNDKITDLLNSFMEEYISK